MSGKEKNSVDKLWDVFSSMKLGLILLGVIATLAAIGTFFPQINQDPEGVKTVGSLWKFFGFTNLYATWWFRLLLGLLSMNLIICTIQRFQGIYTKTFQIKAPKNLSEFSAQNKQELSGDSDVLKHQLHRFIKEKRYYVVEAEVENGWSFKAVKKRWGYWGSLLTHISFVILLLGALIGTLLGFKGYFMAGAGTIISLQQIEVSRGAVDKNFIIKVNSAEDKFLSNGERDNWYTDLSILEGNKEVLRQTLSVNHPLTYKGVTFYQANFSHGVNLTFNRQGQNTSISLSAGGGDYYHVPGTDLYFIVNAMKQDVQNPIIIYQVFQGNNPKPVQSGQLQKGETVKIKDAFDVTLNNYAGFTGLQVKEDPGVLLIWTGSGLLLIGLMLSFYWRPVVMSGFLKVNGNEGRLLLESYGKGKTEGEKDIQDFELAFIQTNKQFSGKGGTL